MEQKSSTPAPQVTSFTFWVLMIVQFLGAGNDNLLKGILTFMVIDGVWSGHLGDGGQAIVFIVFTVPFLIFSGVGGPLADKYSKSMLATRIKWIEFPLALLAGWAFWTQNLGVALVAMFLLTTQSAFFGPVKYGMLPEIVESGRLARANGWMNMSTNVAAILATKASGVISDYYDPKPGFSLDASPDLLLPGWALVGVALVGGVAALFFTRLNPVAPSTALTWNAFSVYRRCIAEMRKGALWRVTTAWAGFYAIATFALLIIPEYAIVLDISRSHAADLLLVLSIFIALGSLTVGRLAGRSLGLRYSFGAAVGMLVCFIALAFAPKDFTVVAVLLGLAGCFAGAYIVPLQASLQFLSPASDRGRFLATANAISFAMMAISAVAYKLIRAPFGDDPHRVFLVCAGLSVTGLLWTWLRGGLKWIEENDRKN